MPAEGNAGFIWQQLLQSRTRTSHWRNHNRVNKMPSHFFFVFEKESQQKIKSEKRKHRNSQWREEGLSSLCVHKLHLHAGRHPTPVAPLGLHLVLDGANWIHSTEQVSRSYMSRVHKICWLSNHASVNPPAPFRLRLFCNTAVETQPEFTHAYSPQYKWAPVKFSNLSSGSFTKHAPW